MVSRKRQKHCVVSGSDDARAICCSGGSDKNTERGCGVRLKGDELLVDMFIIFKLADFAYFEPE